jgi:hypothetical protein
LPCLSTSAYTHVYSLSSSRMSVWYKSYEW